MRHLLWWGASHLEANSLVRGLAGLQPHLPGDWGPYLQVGCVSRGEGYTISVCSGLYTVQRWWRLYSLSSCCGSLGLGDILLRCMRSGWAVGTPQLCGWHRCGVVHAQQRTSNEWGRGLAPALPNWC